MHPVSCPQTLRQMVRGDQYKSHTSGQANGFLQCNLVIVPALYSEAFELFCHQNPKACPLIAKSAVGSYQMPDLGDIDLRFDVANYQIFEYGKPVRQQTDIQDLWREDFVAFALGCCYSFEEAFDDAGFEIRNVTEEGVVPMYLTDICCKPVPPFEGQLIVSMHPFLPKDIQLAIEISAKFPKVHVAPIEIGNAVDIGISDLSCPDFGESVNIGVGEITTF